MEQQQHQGAAIPTHPKPVTPLLRTHHHENVNQVGYINLVLIIDFHRDISLSNGVRFPDGTTY
jgi:hypothetical protein